MHLYQATQIVLAHQHRIRVAQTDPQVGGTLIATTLDAIVVSAFISLDGGIQALRMSPMPKYGVVLMHDVKLQAGPGFRLSSVA